jgi:hypothetical protein
MFRPEEHEDLIGQWYKKDDFKYQLKGIILDKEDWWWMLTRDGICNEHTQMLSCVCNIEMYGYEMIE